MRRTVLCVLFALLIVLFTSSTVFATIQENDDEAQVMASELAYLQQAFVQTHQEVAEDVDTLFWQELGQKFRRFGSRIKAKFQSIFKPKNNTAVATPNQKVASNNATESTPSTQVPQWLKSTKLPAYVRDAIVRLKNLHLKVKSFEELKNSHKPISDQEVKVGLSELLNHVESKDKSARRKAIGDIVRAAKKANKRKAVKKLHKIGVKILTLKDKLEDMKTKKQQEEKVAPITPADATAATPAPAPVPEAAAQKEATNNVAPVKTEDKIAELKQKIKATRAERTKKLKKLVEMLNKEGDKKKQKSKKTKKPKKDNKKRGRKPRVFVANKPQSSKGQKLNKKGRKNINKAFKRLFEKIKSHYKKVGLRSAKKLEEPKERPVDAKKAEEKPVEVKKVEEKPVAAVKVEAKPVKAVEIPVEVKSAKKAEKASKKEQKKKSKKESKKETPAKKEKSAKPKTKKERRIPSKSEVAEAIQRLIDRVETLRNQGSAKYFSLIVKLKKVNRLVQSPKPDAQRLNTFLSNLIKRSGVVHPKIPEVMKKLRTVINASLTAGEQITAVQPAKSAATATEKVAEATVVKQ